MKRTSKSRWAILRRHVWDRDEGLCVVCGGPLDPEWWECHHRRYRSRGGLDEMANLIALHPRCHATAIHEDTTGLATANGWAVSAFGLDGPRDIPVRYWDGSLRLLTSRTCEDAA